MYIYAFLIFGKIIIRHHPIVGLRSSSARLLPKECKKDRQTIVQGNALGYVLISPLGRCRVIADNHFGKYPSVSRFAVCQLLRSCLRVCYADV